MHRHISQFSLLAPENADGAWLLQTGPWIGAQPGGANLPPPPAGNVSWKSGVSGDWTNAADWTGGVVPGASNDVTIGVSGTYTVSVTSADAAHSLTIGNANTTVADNAGALAIGTKLSLNAGTLALSNGGFISGGTLSIAAGAVLTGTANGTINSAVADSGSILITTGGLLELDGGGILGGTLSGAGTLGLGAGSFSVSSMGGSGTLGVYNGASLVGAKPSGTLSVATVLSAGGTLAAAAGVNLTLTGPLSFGSAGGFAGTGYLAGPGTITTTGATTMNDGSGNLAAWLGGGLTWVNAGTVNDSGIAYFNFTNGDSVSIVNAAGASFNFIGDSGQFLLPTAGTDKFSNAGTLAKTGGSGVNALMAAVNNTGAINVVSGTLELDAGGSLGGSLAGAGTLGLGGGAFTTSGIAGGGNIAIYNGATLTGTVATAVVAAAAGLYAGGTLAVGNGDTLNLSAGLTVGSNAGFAGTGYIEGPGTLTTNGLSTINDGSGNLALWFGGGATWVNAGTVNDSGIAYLNFTAGDNVTIVNKAGASFNFTNDSAQFQLPVAGSDSFANAGTLAKTGGTGISALAMVMNNTGVINVATGTLELDAGGMLNGSLSGAGTLGLGGGIFTTGGLGNGGTLSVYNGASLTGTATSGSIAAAVSVYGGGTLSVSSGHTLTLSSSLSVGSAAGFDGTGYLSGAGTLATNGVSTIYDGSGNLAVWLGGGLTWVNAGTVNDGGIAYVNFVDADAVTIVNKAGATFNLVNDSAQIGLPAGGTDLFSNAGLLAKTGGTGMSSMAMNLANSGTVSAASGTLQIIGSASNSGLMRATGGGTLDLSQAVLSNISGAALNGGMFWADAHSTIELANDTSLVTDSASITLSGAGSAIQSLNTGMNTQISLDSTLGTIAAAGTLSLLNGRNFVSGVGNFVDNGLLGLSGVTFKSSKIAVNASGTVSGFGTISAAIADAGTISAAGGTLILAGAVTGSGALLAGSGATINLTKGGALTETISGPGTLELSGAAAYTMTAGTIGSSFVAIDVGATLSGKAFISGAVADAGTLAASGGALTVAGIVNGAGTMTAAAGATLDLLAGGNFAGSVSGAGTLQLDGATGLILQASKLSISTVKIDTGAKLELTGGGALTSLMSGAGTVQLDGAASYALSGAGMSAANLVVSTGATLTGTGTVGGAIADSGILQASGGTMTIGGAVSGTGILQANAGAVLDLAGGGNFGGSISGAGTLRLDGATPFIVQHAAAFSIASVVVDAGATLELVGGASLGAGFSGGGTLQLDGGNFSLGGTPLGVGTLLLDANAALSGSGTIAGSLVNNGMISTTSGTLLVTGGVSGAGSFAVASASTLDLAGGGNVSNVSGAGTLRLDGPSVFTVGDAGKIKVASLTIGAGANVGAAGQLAGAVADDGTLTATSGTLSLAGALSGAGVLAANAGGVLDIAAGGSFAGALTGAGTVRIDGVLTLNAGATLAAATIMQTANVTLGAGETLTNLGGHTYTVAAASKKIVALAGSKGDTFTNGGTLAATGPGTEKFTVGVVNAGSIVANAGTLSFLGAVTNAGAVDAAGGTVTFKLAVGGAGTVDIDTGGTASFLKGCSASQHVDFGAGGGLLELTKATTFKGVIMDFAAADKIDLIKTTETSYSFGNGVLTVKNSSTTVANLHFAGSYTTADFVLAGDGHGGTVITHA